MIQRVFSKYNLNRRFASVLLQFCLQTQEQFCNKMFPGEKNTYRKLRKQIPADVYFQAILKWAKYEGQQRAFLLKKWRKNGEKNAKNIERSAGSLVLLHNRYQIKTTAEVVKDFGFFYCHKTP